MKMYENVIGTERLVLVPCDERLLQIILKGEEPLAEELRARVETNWSEYGTGPFEYVSKQIKGTPENYVWWSYLVMHRRDNSLIGSCGYKGAPDRGMVEIGYGIAPAYRLKGYATEVAAALVEHAFENKEVKLVQAHTLAEVNESNHLLRKIGMTFMEEKLDPDDGPVWRWAMARP